MMATNDVFALVDWRQKVGIEREYKWFVGPAGPDVRLDPTPVEEMLSTMPLPDGYQRRRPYGHRQSLVFLDDDWRLTRHQTAVSVVVNEGPTGTRLWVKTKQTISWHDSRRDALEIAETVDGDDLAAAIANEATLPVQYLCRTYGGKLALAPYAKATQVRYKMGVLAPSGSPMMVSWDDCLVQPISGDTGGEHSGRYLEVETNMLDRRSADELDAVAAAITAFLGSRPQTLSKPEWAATLAGWEGTVTAAAGQE